MAKVNLKCYEYSFWEDGKRRTGNFSIREDVPVEKVEKQIGRKCRLVDKITIEY